MRVLIVIAMLACSGCSVTLNATGKWSDTIAPDVELRKQYDQLNAAAKRLTQELAATPPEMDAVSAVLTKYGIKLQGE